MTAVTTAKRRLNDMSTSVPVPDTRQPSITVKQPKSGSKARTAKRRQKATGANKSTKARKPPGPSTRPETKTAKVLHLLKRSGGATLNDLPGHPRRARSPQLCLHAARSARDDGSL